MCMCIFMLWFVCFCLCVCACACLCVCVCVSLCVRLCVCARVIGLFIQLSLAYGYAHTQSFRLGARPRYSSLHTQTQSFIYTVYSSISENRVHPMAQLLAWWRGVRRTSPSSPRIHMAPGVLPHKTPARHSGETKAPVDTSRKPRKNNKKNGKPGTILVPYHFTSSLSVLSAAQLIQQHTSPSLTQSQPEIHHSSSSSPPPRYVTMHIHISRAFNIQYSNICDLKPTSQTLDHFINAQASTMCILYSLLQ